MRRYGKGVLGSLWRNLRYIWIPCLVVLLIGGGYYAYVQQPFIDHSPPDGIAVEEPLAANASLLRTDVDLHLKTSDGTVQGQAIYRLANNNTKPQRCQLSVNPGYKITAIRANGKALPFTDLAMTQNASRPPFACCRAHAPPLCRLWDSPKMVDEQAYNLGYEVGDAMYASAVRVRTDTGFAEAKAGARSSPPSRCRRPDMCPSGGRRNCYPATQMGPRNGWQKIQEQQ